MYCPRCGSDVPDGGRYCPKCGADLRVGQEEMNAADGKAGSFSLPAFLKQHRVLTGIVCAALALVVFFLIWFHLPRQRYARQMALGQRYLKEEDYEEAVSAFTNALNLVPESGEAMEQLEITYVSWAGALEKEGDSGQAAAILRDALSLYPDSEKLREAAAGEESAQVSDGSSGAQGSGSEETASVSPGGSQGEDDSLPISFLPLSLTDYQGDEFHIRGDIPACVTGVLISSSEDNDKLSSALDVVNDAVKEQVAEETKRCQGEDSSALAYTDIWQADLRVMRSDTTVVSIVSLAGHSGQREPWEFQKGWNIDPSTGELLSLSDVVTDTDTLSELLGYDVTDSDFAMGYEGLYLFSGADFSCIPWTGIADLVDARYTQAPDCYVVPFSPWGESVTTDLDGDGQADAVSLSPGADEYDVLTGMSVSINGQSFAISTGEDDYGMYYASHMTCDLIHTPSKTLLLYSCPMDDGYATTFLVTLDENGVTFDGSLDCGPDNSTVLLDPSDVRMTTIDHFIGTAVLYRDYDLTQRQGDVFYPLEEFFTYEEGSGFDNTLTTKTKVTLDAVTLEEDGSLATGKSVTIPAGESLTRLYTDREHYLVLQRDDGSLVELTVDGSADSWPVTYQGVDVMDLFDGIYLSG